MSRVAGWLLPTWLGKFIVSSRGECAAWLLPALLERLRELARLASREPRVIIVSPCVSNCLLPKVSLEKVLRESSFGPAP